MTGRVEAIKETARRQLGDVGPAALSLRAVARELDLVSSALYRYFPSRDALLTALVVDAYDDLGEVAERAAAAAADQPPGARWLQVCRAVRGWALAHPHEFALVYGSPVPGYAAPQDTVGPASRVPLVLAEVLSQAQAAGLVAAPRQAVPGVPLVSPQVRELISSRADSTDLVERSLVLWVVLVGSLSFELFGHLVGVVEDRDAWFDAATAVAAEGVGLHVPLDLAPDPPR